MTLIIKERPIIFNSKMVRAILAGRKSQTRRLIKNPDYISCTTGDCPHSRQAECDEFLASVCPIAKVGDGLWVRESFWAYYTDAKSVSVLGYRADLDPHMLACPDDYQIEDPWFLEERCIPSIHMPRWASRISLKVTGVRAERLNQISDTDAQAEGFHGPMTGTDWANISQIGRRPAECFRELWEVVNGDGSWKSNPWVWVVEFNRVNA